MIMKLRQLACVLLALSLTVVLLPAVQPSQWTISSIDDFLEGELKGVSITGDGALVPAPGLESIFETNQAFVHAAILDATGNLYLGTGNEGRVFRVNAAGQGKELVKLEEAGIHALAIDSTGRLYAGTSPDGKVYRIDDTGKAEPFFKPNEKYIWSMVFDSRNNLYVGTGPKGIIYKVSPDGKSETFYDSKETHIVTLEIGPDGQIYAGTAPGALVFRVSPEGKPFVLYDSKLDEIKCFAFDRYGNVYAAALKGTPAVEAEPAVSDASAKPKAAVVTAGANDAETEDATVKVAGTDKGKRLEIYKIGKDGTLQTIYTSGDGLAYDLLMRADGNLLIATSNKGRLISVDQRGFATYLAQTSEEQVTQLAERNGALYAVTSNLGKVFRVGGKSTTPVAYESKVLDAGMVSSWGVIRWRGRAGNAASVKVYTRSGNTETADQTWTDWDGPYEDAKGSPVKSLPARFLQVKVEFAGAAAGAQSPAQADGVDTLSVAYLQQNTGPELSSITVHPAGLAFAEYPGVTQGGGVSPGGPDGAHIRSLPRSVRELEKQSTAVPPRKIYYPGARSISWSCTDPNSDDLVYSVHIKRQEEANWVVLKDDLQETHYTLDGASFPDGTYVAKVTASDRLSNPQGKALEDQLISRPFVIANTSPVVDVAAPQIQGRNAVLELTARTAASTVHQVEYSIDGGDWFMVFPSDGIADSESEKVTIRLENLPAGTHTVRVRLVDSVGNVGTGKASVTVQ